MPEAHETDESLVTRARSGDEAAFGLLVERHQDALLSGIWRMVGRREDAEDLAQEALVKAFRGIRRFEGRSSFYTWLYSIAVNVVISYRRKLGSKRHRQPLSLHAGNPDGGTLDVADTRRRPEVVTEHREVQERIEQAVEQLDDEHRIVVVLRDIEGFDYESIGAMLDCPVGTVKSRLHRARLALREQLKDLLG